MPKWWWVRSELQEWICVLFWSASDDLNKTRHLKEIIIEVEKRRKGPGLQGRGCLCSIERWSCTEISLNSWKTQRSVEVTE